MFKVKEETKLLLLNRVNDIELINIPKKCSVSIIFRFNYQQPFNY